MTYKEKIEQQVLKYGNDLMKKIIAGFNSYELYFRGESGKSAWDIEPVVFDESDSSCIIDIFGVNDALMDDIEESDYDLFKKFITDLIDNFVGQDGLTGKIYSIKVRRNDLYAETNKPGLKVGICLDVYDADGEKLSIDE